MQAYGSLHTALCLDDALAVAPYTTLDPTLQIGSMTNEVHDKTRVEVPFKLRSCAEVDIKASSVNRTEHRKLGSSMPYA